PGAILRLSHRPRSALRASRSTGRAAADSLPHSARPAEAAAALASSRLPGENELPTSHAAALEDSAGMSVAPSIPDRVGNTPMVRLGGVAAGLPVDVFGKCEFLNPGGSVKDRIAVAILDDAERRGLLRPGMTLVEATAGNTGVGLALVAAIR